MSFNRFKTYFFFRIIFLTLSLGALIYVFFKGPKYVNYIGSTILLVFIFFQISEIFKFSIATHNRLLLFLESIRYSDFTLKFSSTNQPGANTRELNNAFNEVLDAFRKERTEKQESIQYLSTIVKQVNTGLLAYNKKGHIELVNENAKKYLSLKQIKNVQELMPLQPELYKTITELRPNRSTLFHKEEGVQLAINATSIKIKNKLIKLLAFQNIYPEVQKIELESWQNLSKVLRHEIMNSINPIASLNSTMLNVLHEDLVQKEDYYILDSESYTDLREGLHTVATRTKGLIHFVNAYQDYTNIPKPQFRYFSLKACFNNVSTLLKTELSFPHMNYRQSVSPSDIQLWGDQELIEMVIINLMKNALESLHKHPHPGIELRGRKASEDITIIEVVDNGDGIIPEALDKIFIPFYSTKKKESGIGLSLSRQIVQMHNGSLSVISTPGVKTTFTIKI
ncbi:sensor histidine kinase [Spongiimicrobium salis]|uniref:sensor histidine kinase n=1 Tax=Spongiimicrobium salis TaxID=1667022 RepID=UPI00374CFB40